MKVASLGLGRRRRLQFCFLAALCAVRFELLPQKRSFLSPCSCRLGMTEQRLLQLAAATRASHACEAARVKVEGERDFDNILKFGFDV